MIVTFYGRPLHSDGCNRLISCDVPEGLDEMQCRTFLSEQYQHIHFPIACSPEEYEQKRNAKTPFIGTVIS